MIKVNGRVVIFNETIFVPSQEEAEIELEVGENDRLILIIAFEESSSEKEPQKASFNISGDGGDKGKLIFKNWTDTFGSSITKPVPFATDNNGKQIYLLGNAIKLGEMYKVEIQIMIEGEE